MRRLVTGPAGNDPGTGHPSTGAALSRVLLLETAHPSAELKTNHPSEPPLSFHRALPLLAGHICSLLLGGVGRLGYSDPRGSTSAGQQMAGQQTRLQHVTEVRAAELLAWGPSLVVVLSFIAIGRLDFCNSGPISGMKDILSVVVNATQLAFFL